MRIEKHQSARRSKESVTDYAPDGRLLHRVRNATGIDDANPTLVKLSPGVYRIQADAEDYNDVTLTVMIPVCIKPGQRTAVRLDGNWKAPVAIKRDGGQSVRLPNGNIVGWRVVNPDSAENPTKANG